MLLSVSEHEGTERVDHSGDIRHGRWRQRGARDPGLAVARELRARGHTVHFIGTRRGMEAKLVPAEDFPIEWIEIGGLKRVGLRKTALDAGALPWSVWQASRMLRRAAPAAVFSTGGYVAGPVLMAALRIRIPVVVMEPNAVPGLHPSPAGQLRGARAGDFPGNREFVSAGTRGGHRPAGARGILRRPSAVRGPRESRSPF